MGWMVALSLETGRRQLAKGEGLRRREDERSLLQGYVKEEV
jgi:hypothetical protein